MQVDFINNADAKKTVRSRPMSLRGRTYRMRTGCGSLYVIINEDDHGLFELFTKMGKAGGCAASQGEALGRMISICWRSGVEPEQVIKQLQGISCHSPWGLGENKILSCADAVAKAIKSHMASNGNESIHETVSFAKGACPECGGILSREKCPVCFSCGHSECS